MFGKALRDSDTKTIVECLKDLYGSTVDLIESHKELKRQVQQIKTKMDDDLKAELKSVENKYINMLECKLIQFDEEAAKLKGEKNAEFQRLHGYYYKNTLNPVSAFPQ